VAGITTGSGASQGSQPAWLSDGAKAPMDLGHGTSCVCLLESPMWGRKTALDKVWMIPPSVATAGSPRGFGEGIFLLRLLGRRQGGWWPPRTRMFPLDEADLPEHRLISRDEMNTKRSSWRGRYLENQFWLLAGYSVRVQPSLPLRAQ